MASELRGTRELSRQLAAFGSLVEGRGLRAAVRAGIKPALERARAAAPVRDTSKPGNDGLRKTHKGNLVAPGFLSRSVLTRVYVPPSRKSAFAFLGVRQEAYYGLQFLELGTSRISKRPWLVPAFSATRSDQLTAIAASLRKTLEQIARKK